MPIFEDLFADRPLSSLKMKFAVALSLVSVAVASVLEQRNCAGNNCNRAVTGTRDGLPAMSLRSADCSSFLLTTVTPAPT